MFVDTIGRPEAETILEHLATSTAMMGVAQLRTLGGAMARVPVDATAFAHRQSRIMVNCAAVYERPDEIEVHGPWVEGFASRAEAGRRRRLRQLPGGSTARRGSATPTPERPGTGSRTIKARYDPTNLFHRNQNIPPATEDAAVRFKAEVLSAGKTATGVEVPAKVVEQLGSKRPKVRVTINGYTYRSSVAPMSGTFMPRDQRRGARTGGRGRRRPRGSSSSSSTPPPGGDRAGRPREGVREGARGQEGVLRSLSYSRKRWYVEGIEGAKKPETRQRRVEKAIEDLREGAT